MDVPPFEFCSLRSHDLALDKFSGKRSVFQGTSFTTEWIIVAIEMWEPALKSIRQN